MVSQTAPEPQALDEELKALCLSTIRRNYRDCAIQAAKETLGCEAYLQELVSRELEARRVNRIARLLHGSRLPRDKTLDAFDMGRLPRRISQQVRSLLYGSFLARRENILAFGNPGSGKTHLLCAIGLSGFAA